MKETYRIDTTIIKIIAIAVIPIVCAIAGTSERDNINMVMSAMKRKAYINLISSFGFFIARSCLGQWNKQGKLTMNDNKMDVPRSSPSDVSMRYNIDISVNQWTARARNT